MAGTVIQPTRSLADFTPAAPIRLTIGLNASGQVVRTDHRTVSIVGTVEIHTAFADSKSIKTVGLSVNPSIPPWGAVAPAIRDTSFAEHRYVHRHVEIWEGAFTRIMPEILNVPFSIPLPPVQQPSSYTKEIGPVSFSYEVIVRAERSGLFSEDIVIKRQVSIPPRLFNELLLSKGTGRDLVREEKLDLVRDEGKGTINMYLCIPGQDRPFPMDTDIPFTVTLATASVPVEYTPDPEAAGNIDAFTPAVQPESLHQVLHLQLVRRTCNQGSSPDLPQTQGQTKSTLAPDLRSPPDLRVETHPREWLHSSTPRSKGRWVQRFVFRSHLRIDSGSVTPTFRSESNSVNYELELSAYVPLFNDPGRGDQIKTSIPIEIISRPQAPVPSHSSATLRAQSNAAAPAPPRALSPSTSPSSPSFEQRRARKRQLQEQMHSIQAELATLADIPDENHFAAEASRSTLRSIHHEEAPVSLDTEEQPPPTYHDVVDGGA
ncbi:hypothetical protein HWV62_39724 [Athelia sp. TMB]|nr:hypothetical protein HWV62_39724 [Athelia sp. TMB]